MSTQAEEDARDAFTPADAVADTQAAQAEGQEVIARCENDSADKDAKDEVMVTQFSSRYTKSFDVEFRAELEGKHFFLKFGFARTHTFGLVSSRNLVLRLRVHVQV